MSFYPSASGGWATVMDDDITSYPNTTLSPDGNYIVNTRTWTKYQSSGDAAPMAFVNGQGLVIQPISASDDSTGTITCPQLFLPFSQIAFPRLPSWSDRYRLWIYNSADNIAATFDGVGMYIGKGNTQLKSMQCMRGNITGSGVSCYLADIVGGTRVSNTNSAGITSGATNRVMMLETSFLQGERIFQMGFFGQYSAGWPDPVTGLRPVTFQANIETLPSYSTTENLSTQYGISLFAKRAGSLTALSATIARVRLDWLAG